MTDPGVVRRAALPVLALALGLAAPGRSAAQAPPAPEPVRVAEAFTAAWNAHDLPAVLALLAPDAVVRERQGPVPPHVWDTRDRVYVSSAYGPEMWAFRRRDGRLVATIRVGQVPADLVTGPAA